jgi:DNA (cytosine-5)-methyltransferase 1
MAEPLKVLNLYAGVGGNRKLWENVEVVAVENDPKIAAVYQKLYPQDDVFVEDAHQFLLEAHEFFDFVWSSPPCQSHSRMVKAGRNRTPRYPDMDMYEEIIFLQHFFKGGWIVENVKPYYTELIKPTEVIGRHWFWSSFDFEVEDVPRPTNFINSVKDGLMEWLDIYYEEKLYYGTNKCLGQVLRNCVHPKIGNDILNSYRGN